MGNGIKVIPPRIFGGNLIPLILLSLVFSTALSLRISMLHDYRPTSPWVWALTMTHAEMGRNLINGNGWSLNYNLMRKIADRVQKENRLVDIQDFLPVDDSDLGAPNKIISYAHAPGYSLWLAVGYLLGGQVRFIYSQYMQAVLDSCAVILIFLMGQVLFNKWAGLAAGMLYALSPVHAFLANLAVQAATDSFWFLTVSYGAILIWKSRNENKSYLPGILITTIGALAGAMMNSTAYVLPGVLMATSIFLRLFDKRQFSLTWRYFLCQVLVVLVLMPWAYRNYLVYDQFTPIRGTSAQILWSTWGELPNPWGLDFDDKYYWNWVNENCPDPCTSGARQEVAKKFLIHTVILSHQFPRHLWNMIKYRAPELYEIFTLPPGLYKQATTETEGKTIYSLASLLNFLNRWMWIFFPLAFLGFVYFIINKRTYIFPALLGASPSIFLITFNLITFISVRKTIPGYSYFFVFAGGGVIFCGTIIYSIFNKISSYIHLTAPNEKRV